MRLRSRTWLAISVLSLVGAAIFWRLGEQQLSRSRPGAAPATEAQSNAPAVPSGTAVKPEAALKLLAPGARLAGTAPAALRDAVAAALPAPPPGEPAVTLPVTGAKPSLRLRNTSRTEDELLHDHHAVLLRNALIDTRSGAGALKIPEHLRSGTEPGSFIVQARGSISPAFRAALRSAGAEFVSYLPNNAYLVSATAAQAETLRGAASIQAVLPFEPYFKLEPGLLRKAVGDEAVAEGTRLNLSLLPGTKIAGKAGLEALGAKVLAEFETPFGPALTVLLDQGSYAALARLPEVQGIELLRQRKLANDLSRERFGISSGTNAPGSFTNYLGLTGTNVWININDSGVDATHPDLTGRVTSDQPSTLVDLDGHGTHVAGTIAGNGSQSGSISNAPGSVIPGADMRGMAPAAKLFALPIDLITGPLVSDTYLQQTAATNYYVTQGQTNILLSNNSWGYIGAFEYTLASASYDAAVRDALPEMPGAQPIAYVFAAGNEGFGSEDGQGGEPSTIRAPGTGKNVITVGAIESPRGFTNEVTYVDDQGETQTNQVFLAETDTDFQITSFSGRGNVEPGIEGRFGRFKPDVVAPGAFTLSTRSKFWTDPMAFSDANVSRITGQQVVSGGLNQYSLFVPQNAAGFRIRVLPNDGSPRPMPGLPVYLRQGSAPTTDDLVSTNNEVRVPPAAAMAAGDWRYSIGNLTPGTVAYDLMTVITLTNSFDDYFVELKKINDGVGPHYRYESGTSMATPAVTGLLALYQDWFQKNGRAATPALLKALLINGARSLGSLYNFNVSDVINLQGWGAVSLTNTLPAYDLAAPTGTVHAIQYLDSRGTDSLVTGQSRSWKVKIAPEAVEQILKLTLVWTDPPGNPSAGLKLVNDLDLEVRNDDSGETFVGNDIPYRSDFNIARTSGESLTNDVVNNVENILLRPPLGTNYTITVRGARVNVNAVSQHPDGIAQDFAFVASLEDKSLTNALTLTAVSPDLAVNAPHLVFPTNGLALLNQRVGANSPRLGTLPGDTNQWTFFVFTNLQQYTPEGLGMTNGKYVAFITFLPPNLGRPRNRDADIDLYVSTNPALTNLNPAALNAALKSTKPGGTELVSFSDSTLGTIYYVGVKAQDQQAAEFGFVALSTDQPFDEDDPFGNRVLRGLPPILPIPDGTPDTPQAGYVFGISTRTFPVQRVVVTNTFAFDSTGDILGNLSHDGAYSVLNNHALDPNGVGNVSTLIFDDSASGDIGFGTLLSRPTDGPGRLTDFVGADATGPWILSLVDNALTQNATNIGLRIQLQPQITGDNFFFTTVLGNSANLYYVDVPANATNLSVKITGINRPLWVAVRRGAVPTVTDYDKAADILPTGGELRVGLRDAPPLRSGRWYVGVFNFNPQPVNYGILIDVDLDLAASADLPVAGDYWMPIADDARVVSRLRVNEDRDIVDVRVGLRVDHPRVSDLTFHVVSPQGTRLLLAENRGGPDGVAYGADLGKQRLFTTFTDSTNLTRLAIKDGTAPFTNNPVVSGAANKVIFADGFENIEPNIYALGRTFGPGWLVTSGGASVIRATRGTGALPEGSQYLTFLGRAAPGIRIEVPIVPDKDYRLKFAVTTAAGGSPQGLIASVGGTGGAELRVEGGTLGSGWNRMSLPFAFSTNLVVLEFKVPDGYTGLALDDVVIEEADVPLSSHYLPEEPIKPLIGQRALGDWKLEVTDTRAGPASPIEARFDWRLEFVFAVPGIDAIRLTNGVPYFGVVNEEEVKYFYVEVPKCATIATNTLSGDLGSLLLFGDRDGLPTAGTANFTDDFGPYLNVEAGGLAQFTLTTSTRPLPLIPGQRLYLAVANYRTDALDNPFGIRVGFDCEDPLLPTVPSLTNGVPVRSIIQPGPSLEYYQLDVATNSMIANFALRPIDGNVDLFIRRGRLDGLPLPTPNNWDYKSDSADPTVTDFVRIDLLSPPMPLEPGIWYVGVRNASTTPVQYELLATEVAATVIPLLSGVSVTNSIPPVDPLVGLSPTNLQYYAFLVASNSIRANFELMGASGDVNLYVHKGPPLASPAKFDFSGRRTGTTPEFIAVTNTTAPVRLSPGWWYLTVENADVADVAYTIRATDFPVIVTPLTSGVTLTNNFVAPGPNPTYFSFDVSPGAISATFEVFDMTSDVHLILKPGLPLPVVQDYAYESVSPGLTPESIQITPYSFPTGLTPGPWYLAVLDAGSSGGALSQFSVRATEEVLRIRDLTNGVPQNSSLARTQVDYFRFKVSPGATAAEFRLTSGGTGNLDLYLRKGTPVPNSLNRHYQSVRNGNVDEFIRVTTNSQPIALSAGDWYLTVTNRSPINLPIVGYEITATEFGIVTPKPSGEIIDLVLSTNRTCLTWVSVPGTNYFVVAKSNILEAAWTVVSPTLTADSTQTTWCLEPPGPWRFFDVVDSGSAVEPIAAPVPELRFDAESACVTWNSLVGTSYFVEARRTFNETNWTTLTPKIVATATTTEVCYPINLGFRFFRVGVGERTPAAPTALPDASVLVDRQIDRTCVSWPSRNGLKYLVEARRNAAELNWTVLTEPLDGTGSTMSLCLEGGTEFSLFRVIEGVSVPAEAPPSLPVASVTPSVDASFDLCFTWDALVGGEYFVEAKQRLADSTWTVISPILTATTAQLSYCQPLKSAWRYFQVRRVNRDPVTAPVIEKIAVVAGAWKISWTGPAGARYQVFASDTSPTVWLPLGGPVTSVSGDFEFTDPTVPVPFFRLYRLERLP